MRKGPVSIRYAWFGRSEPVMFCGFFWPGRYCYSTFFSPLGHYVRPTHKVEVSVGDRKSLLVDARPHFAIGVVFWVFCPSVPGCQGD